MRRGCSVGNDATRKRTRVVALAAVKQQVDSCLRNYHRVMEPDESQFDPDEGRARRRRRLRVRLVAFGFLVASPFVYYGIGMEAAVATVFCALILFVVGSAVG